MDATLVQILDSLFGLEQENAQLRAELARRDQAAADETRQRMEAIKTAAEASSPPPGG